MRRHVEPGLRLGCLRIVHELPMRGEGRRVVRWFLCRCDCGRELEYSTGCLFRRETARRDCGRCSYHRGGSRGQVPLSGGSVSLVDEADWPAAMRWTWCVDSAGYANSSGGRLHNFIMGGKGIDHINGDRLDNRRANLRAATQRQNSFNRPKSSNNTSGFKGVTFCKQTKRWRAQVGANGKHHWLGRHDTAEEAARAYDETAERLHGEFARINGVAR